MFYMLFLLQCRKQTENMCGEGESKQLKYFCPNWSMITPVFVTMNGRGGGGGNSQRFWKDRHINTGILFHKTGTWGSYKVKRNG